MRGHDTAVAAFYIQSDELDVYEEFLVGDSDIAIHELGIRAAIYQIEEDEGEIPWWPTRFDDLPKKFCNCCGKTHA